MALAAATAHAERAIAAVPFLAVGVTDGDLATLGDALAERAARRVGGRAVPSAEARARLPGEALPDGCTEDPACLRAAARAAGADDLLLLVATAGRDGASARLAVTRAEAGGTIAARAEALVPLDARQAGPALERLAAELFPLAIREAAAGAPSAAPAASATAGKAAAPGRAPRWLVWTGAGAAVLGVVAIALVATTGDEPASDGTLGSFGPGARQGFE